MSFIVHLKREIIYHPNELLLLHIFTSKLREEPNISLHLLIFMKKIIIFLVSLLNKDSFGIVSMD